MNTLLPWIQQFRSTFDRWLPAPRRPHRITRRPVAVQLEFPWTIKR